jgi:tight adherence protein C
LLIAIAALVFVTVFLLLYIFILSGAEQQLGQRFKTAGIFSSYADYTSEKLQRPLYYRLFYPLAKGIGHVFNALTPAGLKGVLADKLQEAGMDQDTTWRFVRNWGLVNMLLLFGSLFVAIFSLQVPFRQVSAILAGTFLLVFLLPWLVLRSKMYKRKSHIQKALPDVIDLLLIGIQAGTSFDGAAMRVTLQMKGVFVDELRTMLQQIRLGLTRQEALRNLADRCRVFDVSLLVSALVHADHLGVSIAQTLEAQAQMLRKKRVLRAREQAMKAPVKLVFPLVLFLLPLIFLVILAPAVVQFMKELHKL